MSLARTNSGIKHTEVVNEFLLVKWKDESETVIPLSALRDNCPCASCSGEKDVLGNIYKGPPQKMNKNSYRIMSIKPVGYYGIRPVWADGHSSGIYTFALLVGLKNE
jgi:DUF971 family protein|tara:strand:- start:406 stop:726 length:321 start_codon:yes stop_codon:yes gene_type:complete